ncbi:MAG TPA: YbjQ family protein [Micromonosporaceae bacterium]|jgi:uncharacterized protein YbjQ (UPF0145 family)
MSEEVSGGPTDSDVLVVTSNDVPGCRIEAVFGEVFGTTVRSRNMFSNMGAGLKSMFGGELKGLTKAVIASRMEATERMIAEARTRGANAIVAARFDASELGDGWSELCAYGTAVRVTKA